VVRAEPAPGDDDGEHEQDAVDGQGLRLMFPVEKSSVQAILGWAASFSLGWVSLPMPASRKPVASSTASTHRDAFHRLLSPWGLSLQPPK